MRKSAYEPRYGKESYPAELAQATDVMPAVGTLGEDSTAGQIAAAQEAVRYARKNYGSQSTGPAHDRKRTGAGKRVVVVVLCVFAALLLALGAFALWFSTSLDQALAPSADEYDLLKDQLVSVPLDQPFYMLLLGSDSREGSGSSSRPDQSGDNQRSDVIILVRIDAPNRQATMVTIPRDTPYELEDGRLVKINEAYNIGGAAESVKAVSKLTGVNISHYADVRVSELESIVDAVGGVDVYVDRDLSVLDTLSGDLVEISAGQQTLNGKQAQVFARARHEYADTEEGQDYHRQSNVRTLATAIVSKALSRPVNELPGMVLDLAQYVTTDLQTVNLVALAMPFAGGGITVYSCCGPIDGDIVNPEAGDEDAVWMCYRNPEGWAELMRQVDSGVEPGEIDYAATQVAWGY